MDRVCDEHDSGPGAASASVDGRRDERHCRFGPQCYRGAPTTVNLGWGGWGSVSGFES